MFEELSTRDSKDCLEGTAKGLKSSDERAMIATPPPVLPDLGVWKKVKPAGVASEIDGQFVDCSQVSVRARKSRVSPRTMSRIIRGLLHMERAFHKQAFRLHAPWETTGLIGTRLLRLTVHSAVPPGELLVTEA